VKKWLFLSAAGAAMVLSLTITAFAAPQDDGGVAPERIAGRPPARGPAGPVPRLSDGKPDFSGIWNGQQIVTEKGLVAAAGPGSAADVPPMLPWAAKITADRAATSYADDFEARCLPGTPPRIPPYHMSLFSTPKLVLVLFEGNTHMYRQFFVDGSDHPKNLRPTFYGDARAHWEGDTLVVDTIGLNDFSWVDGRGHPHTKQMHLTEKFRRPDYGNLAIDVTIDDPGTFTRPWIMHRVATLETGMEMTEYVCNENNQDPGHLDKAH
jgi:hypothetical protein